MAYEPHLLVNFGGTVGAANPEIWSCGIRLWSDSWSGFDEIGYAADVAIPALTDWVNRSDSKIGSHVSMDWVKVNMIAESGDYQEPNNPHTYFLLPVVVGELNTFVHCYQACVVLSWRTSEALRGLASKGRIYSPGPAVTIDRQTGLFDPAEALTMCQSAKLLIQDLAGQTSPTHTLRPHIMSSTNSVHHEITSVVVDNRVDIQRRRANALVPNRTTQPIVY